ncbi:MAG: SPFH domain-containing protein [Candidatus Peregrinibacteria bacterium]
MKAVILFLFILFPVLGYVLDQGSAEGSSWFILGLAIDIILFFLGVRIVTQKTVKVVEFLGKFNRILHPGINIIIPVLEWTKNQDLFKKNFQVEVDGITKDNVSARIGLNVVYFVQEDDESIYKSVYEIDNHGMLIKATIDEQLRAMITGFDHKEIFTKRQEIGDEIEENLREKLSQFGFTVDSIQVQDIRLDQRVVEAMNRVIETEKLKDAAQNEGEANRIKIVKEAEANKEAKKLIGEGMAQQRMAIANGFQESIAMIQQASNVSGAEILQFLLDSARIETLEKVGDKNAKIIYLNENLEGKTSRIEKFLAEK